MQILHTNPEDFDLFRHRQGERFLYTDRGGQPVSDPEILADIEGLVIPPNWKDVRICSEDCRHIRAYGFDDRGRKQYIYNDKWLEKRRLEKFDRLPDFGKNLPKIRKTAHRHIAGKKWTKQKILGLVTLTLDETYLRIGNRVYLDRNDTYGLTTLRRKHLQIVDGAVVFYYKAKSNKYRKVRVDNNQLVNLIRSSSELPGYEIFRYKQGSRYKSIDSSDVNEYLQNITGADFSSKDFRTWGGTTLAVELLPEARERAGQNKRRKLSTTLIRMVARKLGNTVATCRDYYIHPKIINAVESGNISPLTYRNRTTGKYALSPAEKKTLQLIQ